MLFAATVGVWLAGGEELQILFLLDKSCELANGASSDLYHNMTTVLENHNKGNWRDHTSKIVFLECDYKIDRP